jgi:hypothetical protein
MFKEVFVLMKNFTQTACSYQYRTTHALGVVAKNLHELAPTLDEEEISVSTQEPPTGHKKQELPQQVEVDDEHHKLHLTHAMLVRLLELVELRKDKSMPATTVSLDELAAGLAHHLGATHEQPVDQPISLREQNVRPSPDQRQLLVLPLVVARWREAQSCLQRGETGCVGYKATPTRWFDNVT